MQCYTELLPPTGVTHALSVPFTAPTARNLVVVKTSLLQIFDLVTVSAEHGNSQANQERLALIAEYDLAGTVTDISRVHILASKSGGNALLLSFRDAKLSLVEWDPERHSISTISIHYYEKESVPRSPWVPDFKSCGSQLTVDPSSRCAMLNFGIKNVAILPFHQAGDDLVMDDFDQEMNGDRDQDQEMQDAEQSEDKAQKKDSISYQTPYAASFVLPLTAMDPALTHPISLAFLHEYREPTFGILYSQVATSYALNHERKDVVFYSVFTLDLEQRASTTLLSVSKLPNDLFKVVALPPPVGGALLIGANELIHVDQSGKTNAVAVNYFAKQFSSFPMNDQSDLGLRLENCVVEHLGMDNGAMMLVLSTGELVLVQFKLDGRSVSGLRLRPIGLSESGQVMHASASCSAALGPGLVFIGSEDTDSILLHCRDESATARKVKSEDADEEEDEFDDDDLYGNDLYSGTPKEAPSHKDSVDMSAGNWTIRVLDTLPNVGPLKSITLGKPFTQPLENGGFKRPAAPLELCAAYGSDGAGGIAVLKRELEPKVQSSFQVENAEAVWAVTAGGAIGDSESSGAFGNTDSYVIVAKALSPDKEESVVYAVKDAKLEPFKAPDVNPNEDCTVEIGTLGDSRVVQVLKGEVRVYDSNLGLTQIYPVWEEDSQDERIAVSASFSDPYLLILRDDSSVLLLHLDTRGDLDEVAINDTISSQSWLSGCLYQDTKGVICPDSQKESLLFLLSADCKLYIFRLPNLEVVSVMECVDSTPTILSSEPPIRRPNHRETLSEILVADIGEQELQLPYLILRTGTDDLILYRPFRCNEADKEYTNLKFIREVNHVLPRVPSEASTKITEKSQRRLKPLRILPDLGGLRAVFMPGASASFILGTSKSIPHVVSIRGDFVCGLSSLNISGCEKGFVYIDNEGIVRTCQLPEETTLDLPWPIRRIPMNEQVDYLTYATASNTYVYGAANKRNFKLPDDDEIHPEWRNEVISFFPQVYRGSVRLLSPINLAVIDSFQLESGERVTAIGNINLEISERTQERKDVIVVATSYARGEDIAARGHLYIFDVIEVVPDPEQPEGTNLKLKLIGEEILKGAVTSVSGIGGQGYLIAAQGQKCVVRGLKDDGSIPPVAFIDVMSYVSVVKELRGTGMCLVADALRGLWFVGYSEEPYKMTLFGKDMDELEVVAADFLPDGKRLYMVVADADSDLYILQYDPEDPKSSNGDRLLNRSRFHVGHFPQTVTLLPRTPVSSEVALMESDVMEIDAYIPRHQVLITTQTGAVGLVTSVSEESYRRLSALQSQLTNTLEHACGLNPRAYRAVESDGIRGRGMIDGQLLLRWLDLSRQRKVEIAGRVGSDEWELRADLESISGGGLGYL
ncbi:hypothetical protein VTN49DRAFT_6162 [Thermomyces lanuginosus]|uniref:uncharacterized protein n=1 Tax=Thermomyces lanuginosus TaxID=5541 RepID=UPI0037446BEF